MFQKILVLLLLNCLIFNSQQTICNTDTPILPIGSLNFVINKYISDVMPENSLQTLILAPSLPNLQSYIMKLLPLVAPEFAMAVIILLMIFICSLQLCCWNCCRVKCCGNELNQSTYSVKSVKFFYISALLLVTLLIAVSSFGMVVNHDLTIAATNSQCTGIDFFETIINGNNGSWSGITNLNQQAALMQINFNNNIQQINSYFSNNNLSNNCTPSGNLYQNVYNSISCTSPTQNINCPDGNGNCTAIFATVFCNNSVSNSAISNISNQFSKTVNQSSYALQNLINLIGYLYTNMANVSQQIGYIISNVTNLSTSTDTYESNIRMVRSAISSNLRITQIVIYAFYSFLIFISLIALISICGLVCCKCFKMRCCLYFYWIIFFSLGFIIFLIAGAQYTISLVFIQGCSSYKYFTATPNNFNTLNNGINVNSNLIQGLSNCYFNQGTFTQSLLPTSQILNFTNLQTYLNQSILPANFSTVEQNITINLNFYAANPDSVILDAGTQPSQVLSTLNTYANYSAPGSTQTPQVLKDYLVFNTLNCGSVPLQNGTNNEGNNSCINLYDSSTITDRNNLIGNSTAIYSTNATYLANYGINISTLVNSIIQTNPLITNYPSSYLNYSNYLQSLLNPSIVAQINSFMNPFQNMYTGLNCNSINSGFNDLYSQVCQQFTPLVYSFSSVNIAVASLLAALMIVIYFLIPRMEFYELLDGDFSKISDKTERDNSPGDFEMQQKEMILDTTSYR